MGNIVNKLDNTNNIFNRGFSKQDKEKIRNLIIGHASITAVCKTKKHCKFGIRINKEEVYLDKHEFEILTPNDILTTLFGQERIVEPCKIVWNENKHMFIALRHHLD